MREEIGDPCMHNEHFKLISEDANTLSNQMSDYDSKLSKICYKLGTSSALSTKIVSTQSDDSQFDSNQLNCASTQRKEFSALKGEIDSKSIWTERLLLGFDKLKEEGHEVECVPWLICTKKVDFKSKYQKDA